MRRQLPASRRPLRGGRAATKGPPHLRSQQRYPKVISSSSWSKVPFERPSPHTKWQNTIDFHWVHMLTGWQLGTVDVTRGAAEGCKNNDFFFHLEKSQLPFNQSFSDFRHGHLFYFLYQTTILSQLVILDWSSPLKPVHQNLFAVAECSLWPRLVKADFECKLDAFLLIVWPGDITGKQCPTSAGWTWLLTKQLLVLLIQWCNCWPCTVWNTGKHRTSQSDSGRAVIFAYSPWSTFLLEYTLQAAQVLPGVPWSSYNQLHRGCKKLIFLLTAPSSGHLNISHWLTVLNPLLTKFWNMCRMHGMKCFKSRRCSMESWPYVLIPY